jgi:hypothetical protein
MTTKFFRATMTNKKPKWLSNSHENILVDFRRVYKKIVVSQNFVNTYGRLMTSPLPGDLHVDTMSPKF